MIYQLVSPYATWEYIWETSIGLWKLTRAHIGPTHLRAGRERLYRTMRTLGIRQGIWLPVTTWSQPVSKYTRLREEAWDIWGRNCNLSEIGAKSWDAQDKRMFEGELVSPKKRRHNQIKKSMDRARQTEDM